MKSGEKNNLYSFQRIEIIFITESMRAMEESRNIRNEIVRKRVVLKQLEGVYKTTGSKIQKRRVAREIRKIREEIGKLQGMVLIDTIREESEWKNNENGSSVDNFTLLANVEVFVHREDYHDREMDAVISYTAYFEENYLPILSEYYIKLDFNHSLKRDVYYPQFMELKKTLKEYNYELDIFYNETYNSIASVKDKSIVHKIRQRYLFALDRYFKDLYDFLGLLVDDYRTGGNIILNQYDQINLSEFEYHRRLNGYTVVEALEEMRDFAEEFIRYLGIPPL